MDFTHCYGCMRELEAPGALCPYCGFDNTNDPLKQPDYALPCGTVLNGKYITGRSLGKGGFGITYIGFDLNLEQPVCIKEYFPDGAAMRSATQSRLVLWSASANAQGMKQSRDSLFKEARKAAKLGRLGHVVNVREVFYENETAYITMEYIEGETLKNRLVRTQKTLGEKECVRLLTPVIEDLGKAHELGIIHRDIKPDNIMLRADGEPILLDMGAAKDINKASAKNPGSNSMGETAPSSTMVVSEGFSPPEQYSRSGKIGSWTDVYAMCATIYYCLTGKLVPTPNERSIGEEADYSSLSPEMRDTLEKGLAMKPDERIQTMGELLAALGGQRTDTEEKNYQSAKVLLERGDEASLRAAESLFLMLKNYRDAAKLADECKKRLEEETEKKNGGGTGGGGKKPAPKLVIPLVAGALLLGAGGYYLGTHGSYDDVITSPTPAAVTVSDSAAQVSSPAESPTSTPTPTPNKQEREYAEAEKMLKSGDKVHAAMAFYALGDYADARTRSFTLWSELTKRDTISGGWCQSVGLKRDGTVVGAGSSFAVKFSDWKNITAVSAGDNHTVGLRSDGTVIAIGRKDDGECDVSDWKDIVAIAADGNITLGLKADGTVLAVGENKDGQCNVSDWKDIVAIAADHDHTLGLKADGTVVAVGNKNYNQCDVSAWRNVVSVGAGRWHSVGLREDGTLVTAGENYRGSCDVSDWRDIVAISVSGYHTVGLKSDGTVVATGEMDGTACNVSSWNNIVAIETGGNHTLGLKSDGTVVSTANPEYDYGQCNVSELNNIRMPGVTETTALPSGSLRAMDLLEEAKAMERGDGVARDYVKAAELYENALEAGSNEAATGLGMLYFTGRGVERDYSRARELFEQAAETGDPNACCALGELFYNGYGTKEDESKAFSYYKQAAEKENFAGVAMVGISYQWGNGVEKDEDAAAEWFDKAKTMFEQGVDEDDILTACCIGLLYYYEDCGLPKDYEKAVEYFRKAADAKYPVALRFMGVIYRNGYGVEKDYSKAVEYYQQAADAGDASAMNNIAYLYRYGDGVKQDAEKALEYFQKSVDAGNTTALCGIGDLYRDGIGVEADFNKAVEYYRQAADAGNTSGLYDLGFMYYRDGEHQDYSKAKEYFLKAAEEGNRSSMYMLGLMYHYGKGVSVDYGKAKEWYQKAADAGDSTGMYSLGLLYESGKGVPQSDSMAQEWFRKAADAGYEGAKAKLKG